MSWPDVFNAVGLIWVGWVLHSCWVDIQQYQKDNKSNQRDNKDNANYQTSNN